MKRHLTQFKINVKGLHKRHRYEILQFEILKQVNYFQRMQQDSIALSLKLLLNQ